MRTRSKEDLQLTERQTAEHQLDRSFRGPLLTYFLKRVKNRNEAEDLTQEVFVRLLHHPDRHNGHTLDGYVFTIVTNHAYHGTVIWSWQQALFASGLERQLERTDLPQPLKADLLAAQQTLWRAIGATRSVRSSELWSWSFEDGRYRITPFGSRDTDADESNAAQLWSSVYLAVKAP